MKDLRASACCRAVLAGFALTASLGVSEAQTFVQGLPYHQNFDVGTNTANFSGSGSVASWIYWYNTIYLNTPMTNDVSLDQTGLASSGCLVYSVPFAGQSNTEDVVFGTFGNQYAYDNSVTADMTAYSNLSFWIRADPSAAPRQANGTNVDYGTIDVGFFYPYTFEAEGSPTIPLSASNAWVEINVPINPGSPVLTGITGLGFSISTFGSTGGVANYPAGQNLLFYIDSLQIPSSMFHLPTMFAPQKAVSGLNCIASRPGSSAIFNRYQVATVSDTGYSFVGRPSVTYSWTIKSFPGNTDGNFQQHFFVVNGAPVPFDEAPDYTLADCLFMTVQQANPPFTNKFKSVVENIPGPATFRFRYKTNEPFGNAMLYNTFSPTDAVNNPNAWLVEPILTLTASNGAAGMWSVTFANTTNITVTGPDGSSTNFNIDPAVAALFADPVTLLLGGQPNDTNGTGKAVVYGSFSASGCASPFSDDFLADAALNTGIWEDLSNDTNGLYLVPATAAFWVPWSLPDTGFVLQAKADAASPAGWIDENMLPEISVNSRRQALIDSSQAPGATQGYFQLVQRQFTQLQVLLGGETGASGTPTGKTGSPTPVSGATNGGAYVTVTINAVDPTFHIIPGITDVVSLTSSADPNATEPLDAPLVNGTLTEQLLITTNGSWTVTANDVTATNIASGTSSPITVNP